MEGILRGKRETSHNCMKDKTYVVNEDGSFSGGAREMVERSACV